MELATRIDEIKKEYKRRPMGGQMRMIGPWLEQLALVSSIETLEKGARPFAHLIHTASVGIRQNSREAGPVGPGLGKVLDGISEAVIQTALDPDKIGGVHLMRQAVPFLFTTLLAAMSLLAKEGSEKDEELRQFSFELALHMIAASEILEETAKTLLEICGVSEEKQQAGADILTLSAFALIMALTAEAAAFSLPRMVESLKAPLLARIERVETVLDEALIGGKIAGEKAQELHILLQQAKLTLLEDDIESFMDAGKGFLNSLGVTEELWKKDLLRAGAYSENILTLLKEGAESGVNTLTTLDQQG